MRRRRKTVAPPFDVISAELLDYARRDVLATAALYHAATARLAVHPVGLEPAKAYSTAS